MDEFQEDFDFLKTIGESIMQLAWALLCNHIQTISSVEITHVRMIFGRKARYESVFVELPRNLLLVALPGHEAVGFAGVTNLDQLKAHLSKLYVHPTMQREGVGGALLNEVQKIGGAGAQIFDPVAVCMGY